MFQNTWNRDELYEKVWAAPVIKVAKEYGVSDVAVAKACRKLKVPLPGRGYPTCKRRSFMNPAIGSEKSRGIVAWLGA